MGILVIIKQMLVIAILFFIGYVLYKQNVMDENASKKISGLVIDICNPALAMSCVIKDKIVATHREILVAGLIGIAIYIILIMLGVLLPKLLKIPKKEQKFYHMMTVYTNTGFIGIPLAKAVLPAKGMIYVIIFCVLFSVFFYTHGVYVMRNTSADKEKKEKAGINMGVISGVFTILLCWFQISLPEILGESIVYIGNATTFLSMMLLGVSLAMVSFREIFQGKKIYVYTVLHLIIIPVVIGEILKGIGVDKNMISAFVLMCALPTANLPLILAEKNGEDISVLSQMILLTTVLSLISVPVVMGILGIAG